MMRILGIFMCVDNHFAGDATRQADLDPEELL